MKRLIVFWIAVLLLLSACSSATLDSAGKELGDAITNIADADNKYVLMVKGGYRADDPSTTYEDAFSAFFGTPRWKYFEGEDGQDVVEFTGDCVYREVSVKARIQFIVDEEDGTFQATYLAFNEVPQDAFTLSAVISKAFEEAAESPATSAGTVTSVGEAQRLAEDWLLDHPMGEMAGVAAEDEQYTPEDVRADYFVFELWEAPREFAGLVYVRKSDGYMSITLFHGSELRDLDEWYQEWSSYHSIDAKEWSTSSYAEYITLVYEGDEDSWITLYQDGTFVMQVNLYVGYGQLSGTYLDTEWGCTCHILERDFYGYAGDDVEEFELVVEESGVVTYYGEPIGSTTAGSVYYFVEP